MYENCLYRVRKGSVINVCRATLPHSPHGVMFVIIAPKIAHFIVFRVGQD